MRRLTLGVLAHVDAGKTTLSEAMLYMSGRLKRLGRVDHGDAFLDTNWIERERGITIFSKQAALNVGDVGIQLLDTPGHVDFSAEMERTLQVLDCAVLVISGTDGVQGHTHTLWRLLKRYGIPAFIFVNKLDLAGAERGALMAQLKRLDERCVDFCGAGAELMESAAMCDEALLERYLETGEVEAGEIAELVFARKLFPCYFGSALKLDGVDALMEGLRLYAKSPQYPQEFGARVYKIARDEQGARLTYLKVTGGSLRVKAALGEGGEKIDQIRLYSGARYQTADEAEAGTVCAVTGLDSTRAGDALGCERESRPPLLEPMLTYDVALPRGCDPHSAFIRLSQLCEEDPLLNMVWNEQHRRIQMQLMGEVQLEVLKSIIAERFGLAVEFGEGSIVYRETIAKPSIGIGHFEPLRHYAEVHLLLEPMERGSGLEFGSLLSEDRLDRNWQRLILTHLEERAHLGVLTGSSITDMRISLINGRAHAKHTEGGDFRQATYRAVRQGLMSTESVLLEPWYEFRLELPRECVGRAMTDLQRMDGELSPPEQEGTDSVLTGCAPVLGLRGYAKEVAAYTHGKGRLSCTPLGYRPCAKQDKTVAAIGYDASRDAANPADSVFCTHEGGGIVPWNEVARHAHLQDDIRLVPDGAQGQADSRAPSRAIAGSASASGVATATDEELMAIYERTYGPIKRRDFRPAPKQEQPRAAVEEIGEQADYLLVDGYNIIFAWEELKELARESLDAARQTLMDALCNYQGVQKNTVILVFDAYKVPHNTGDVSQYHNIYVVYTKEAETADAYIERTSREIAKRYRVRVATSDGAEQLIVLGYGAQRVSASMFHEEMLRVDKQIAEILWRTNLRERSDAVREALARAAESKREEKE